MIIRHCLGSYPVRFRTFAEVVADVPLGAIWITDQNLSEAYPALPSDRTLVIKPGETSKSLEVFARLQSQLAQRNVHRSTPLVAFGGGVVGDLAGFVAATYQRGVAYTQIPTSLLAMVDSAVGGKVAVDLPEGKNLVGAFYPPNAVEICPELLDTLPERQFWNGCAEVVKYGAILDRDFFDQLAQQPLVPRSPFLLGAIRRCLELKAHVVQEDEFETTGLRAILNFGHTLGHAIELYTFEQGMLHGEAISIGMVLEARLGEQLGLTEPGTADQLATVLGAHHLPTRLPPGLDPDLLMQAMRRDKKAQQGNLAFSLLDRLGACKLQHNVPAQAVLGILAAG